MLSSFPLWSDKLEMKVQYWLAFVAQSLNGIANTMAISLATKVSQHWFSGAQQILATIILTMASPVGIMIGMSLTPVIVNTPADIPTMNWIWSIPSFITMIMNIIFIRSSYPPTPPSRSAEVGHDSLPFIYSIKGFNIL